MIIEAIPWKEEMPTEQEEKEEKTVTLTEIKATCRYRNAVFRGKACDKCPFRGENQCVKHYRFQPSPTLLEEGIN